VVNGKPLDILFGLAPQALTEVGVRGQLKHCLAKDTGILGWH